MVKKPPRRFVGTVFLSRIERLSLLLERRNQDVVERLLFGLRFTPPLVFENNDTLAVDLTSQNWPLLVFGLVDPKGTELVGGLRHNISG